MSGAYDWDEEDYGSSPVIRRFPVRTKIVKFIHPFSDPENVEKYLNQNKIWIDRDGTDVPIKSLEKDYLFNILAWLDTNSERINFTRSVLFALSGEEWSINVPNISDTPLVKKLFARYKKLVEA